MPWSSWRAHFERNALRPLPAPPRDCDGIPQPWRAPLLRSLARFQVGEAGEGRIARQIDRVALPGVDDDYRVALKLFVREEGRHARILGDIIRAMGGSLLRGHWTEQAFVGARRLAGVRAKLLVLLAAEVVGTVAVHLRLFAGFFHEETGMAGAGRVRTDLRGSPDGGYAGRSYGGQSDDAPS